MKQTTFTLLLAMLMSMVGLHAYAFDLKDGGIYYNLNANTKTAEVTFKGVQYYSYDNEYTGAVVIPSEVTYYGEKYSVTSIGEFAFYGCSNLTSVTIPNSVTSISQQAFSGCSGLTSITIPNSVTSIGERAFSSCSGLTSIIVESGNTTYDSRENCNAIIETASNTLVAGCKTTTIPNSVTSIGYSAFRDCSGLTSVTIPNSVTSISQQAFSGCSGLTSITIPNSVTSIGNSAFDGCSGLTSITIPNGVTSIGILAFNACSGLTSITIPNSVTKIGTLAFEECSGLTSIVVESGNTTYDSRENSNAIIETASNTLLYGCKNTVIPNSVTSIGKFAFYRCSGLTSITIPNSVTSIGERAFWSCYSLTSVTIGSGVTSIGDGAFYACSGLKDVYCYPTEVPETSSYAFGDVTITNVTLHVPSSSLNKYKEHEFWGQFMFGSYSCVSLTYSIDGLSKLKMNILPFDHNLNITAEEGWKVVALTVNGEDKMGSLTDNVLTINISADTEVKVTLGWANEANLYTEDPATGIATIEGEGVKVQAKDGQIWVDGAAGKTVRLYTIGGALMTTVTPTAGNTGKFSVAPGTYIIQVGNKAAKVTVK